MFQYQVQVRWSDIDANRHLRHSVYYDYGASARMHLLSELGLTTQKLETMMIGPILFREEAVFRREILFEDKISLHVELHKASEDYSRWSLRHRFLKEDGTVAATLEVDGAWIDMTRRKLATPDEFIRGVFDKIQKTSDFETVVLKQK